ncbi:MAG TPA: hypothetical protein VLU46_08450 [Thermoanaerobaculia bacterium]|nr:hypothetical protein [Thermoanaerobaculia bacterium]
MIAILLLATLFSTIPPITPGAAQTSVAATSTTAGVRLIWAEDNRTIRTTVIHADRSIDTPEDWNVSDATAASPHIGCSDSDCLAVWLEESAGTMNVVGRFLASPVSFTIAQRGPTSVSDVAVAWTGVDYVVVWSGNPNPNSSSPDAGGAARVNTAGVVMALNAPRALRRSWSSPDVAALPNDALIAWTEWIPQTNGSTVTNVELARASGPTNVRTVATIQVLDLGNYGLRFLRDPRIACDDTQCVLTWTLQNGPGRGSETHFERFSTTLADLQPTIDENRVWWPEGIYFASSQYVIHTLSLWDSARFRLVSGLYDVEERVLLGDSTITAPISNGVAGWRAPLSLAAARLTPETHVVAYTREGTSAAELVVWIVKDPTERRRAARH